MVPDPQKYMKSWSFECFMEKKDDTFLGVLNEYLFSKVLSSDIFFV